MNPNDTLAGDIRQAQITDWRYHRKSQPVNRFPRLALALIAFGVIGLAVYLGGSK